MKLPEYAVDNRAVVLFSMFLLFAGGLYSYDRLGKLEDPEFTIKTAMIMTLYPGASPTAVELQVTDEIERAVQQLEWLDEVRSISKAGISIVYVDIQERYRKKDLPQIWDKMRRKIYDVQPKLPPGAGRPEIYDDWGDVYGVFLALTGDGYSYAELKDYARYLQNELRLVQDVNRVMLWGLQQECVYVEISRARLSELGIHPESLIKTLNAQNKVVYSGSMETGSERIRINLSGDFRSIKEIKNLVVLGTPPEELVLLKDIARVRLGYLDPPETLMRYNGKPAIGLGISTVPNGNVVVMGEAVKKRLSELMKHMPVGVDIQPIFYQAQTVKKAITKFVTNLTEAIVIVIGILLITMGVRSGLLISIALVLSIVGTFVVMLPFGIDLQRASIGALIVAIGMLVDNAIVVTEGALIRLQRGNDYRTAATASASDTGWPLLGATLIAIFAFSPIFLSQNNTGEYCRSLFQVIAISLGLSWIIAMMATPVLCRLFLRISEDKKGTDPYAHPFYRNYRFVLEKALRRRALTLLTMVILLAAAGYGFRYVENIFFPNSERTMFMLEYWLPEGSRIQEVSADLHRIETFVGSQPEVTHTAACIGAGAPRFILEYEPQIPNTSYGILLINAERLHDVDSLIPRIDAYLRKHFPEAEPRLRRFPLGPYTAFKIEARISGPDPYVLHRLSDRAQEIMRSDPRTMDTRDNWRQRVKVLQCEFSQPRARRALVTRPSAAMSLSAATDGIPVAFYREDDELMPVLVRSPEKERYDITNIGSMPVRGRGPESLPLGQIIKKFSVSSEDPIIHRYNRRRTITAQTQPRDGVTSNEVLASIKPEIEAIEMPAGYHLEWGGQYEKEWESQDELFSRLPIALILMAFTVVTLFNAFRQPLIIMLILPLSLIGITVGLLVTDMPFGFMALLGALSLFGMLIKNAVVLLDQVDREIAAGTEPYRAVVISSVSRLRPVLMASFTTVLGMIPLLTDRLYGPMAVTIMFGLTFATALTLLVVPVLYTLFFRIEVKP